MMSPAEAIANGSDLSVSLSGGKDSTATYLHLLDSGTLDAVEKAGGKVYRVFADTGWELPATYAYLKELEERFGKIHRVATWGPGPNEAPPAGYDYLEPRWKTGLGGDGGKSNADPRYTCAHRSDRTQECTCGHPGPRREAVAGNRDAAGTETDPAAAG